MSDRIDTSELLDFANDLGQATAEVVTAVTATMKAAGTELRRDWAESARRTAGQHGRHYPASITDEAFFGPGVIGVQVGPETARKQGGMGPGFEYGSRNQPPHLDGNRAADARMPRILDQLQRDAETPLGLLR